jgi:hypothetical protein
LRNLRINASHVASIEARAGLDNLDTVDLANNGVQDLAPLVANPGIGSGDTVVVTGNPFSMRVDRQLVGRARVGVIHLPGDGCLDGDSTRTVVPPMRARFTRARRVRDGPVRDHVVRAGRCHFVHDRGGALADARW